MTVEPRRDVVGLPHPAALSVAPAPGFDGSTVRSPADHGSGGLDPAGHDLAEIDPAGHLWLAGHHGVGAAEISAMVLEGQILPLVGPVHVTAGIPVTRRFRAHALLMITPTALSAAGALHGETAAWFFSCAPAPERLRFMIHRDHRTTMRCPSSTAHMPWEVRQLVYPPWEIDHFHGLRVSTPVRTAADLACSASSGTLAALELMFRAPHLGVSAGAVVELLRSRHRMPNRHRAIMTVRRLCRQWGWEVPDHR